jgi:hypothetical protein
MPVRVQEQFYAEVEEQYRGLLDYLNKTNQNELEPRTFDLDAKETKSQVLFEGQNPESPFGEDAIYNEYSVKAQGKPMTPVEIRQAIKDNLGGQTREAHTTALLGPLMRDFTTLRARLTDEQQKVADEVVRKTTAFIEAHPIGSMFRVDINGDVYNAIVTNIRSTHKAAGNPYSLSKVQVTIAVNGALRSVTVPATQFQRIETNTIGGHGIEGLFKVGILNDRETAKIITGNLLGAYGELDGTRGSIISFTKADGTTEQGILLPKKFDLKENVRQDYRLKSAEDAFKFVRESQNENIERFGINSRDGNVRVLPAGDGITIQVPKSKAKGGRYFLDSALRAATGDFYSSGSFMRATVRDHAKAVEALDVLMKKQALYALPSMANEARSIVGDEAEPPRSAVASRGAPVVGGGMDAQALRAMVTPIVSSWKNGPKGGVTVVQTADQLPIGVLRSDPDGVAKAWFDPDSQAVYMVASQIKNAGEAQFVLFHEVYGHYGMRSLLGDDYGPAMMRLRLANQQIAARASMWFTRYGRQEVAALVEGGMDRMAAERQVRLLSTEEALADRAGDAEPLKAWQSVAAVIQRTLRSLGLSRVADWIENHTEAETLSMLARARRNVQQRPGEAGAARMSATPAAASREMPVASRGLSAGLAAGVNNAKEVALPAGYVVGDLFNREGKLNWWHKTVGTMHNLAERNPTFKRVYDATQNFINDTSAYATEAADLAPRMLPKLETWKDITKSPLSPEDTQAIAAPIFEGTLTWGRDESGKPVRMADKEAAAEQMDSEQKARELFRRGLVTEPVLKMWQGLPIDQFESIINGKYDRDVLRAGVVWTDDELKSMFKLNDSQIGLYHEFREATDRSLKNLAVSDMLRFGGKDVAAVRDEVLAAATVDRAAEILRDHLFERADSEPERAEVLNDTANKMIDKGDRATDLMKRGYAPLSRFGHYTLDVVNPDGERAYFGMFESAPERSKMARAMRVQYPNATIEQGTVSEEAYKLFAGVSPETLELFGGMLGLESDGTAARDQAFQQFLKLAKANRSAMKRLIERKGIAGFSEDAGRVLAGFVYSNARQTSVNLHGPEISEAVADVPKGPGELRDAAEQLRQYVSNPQEEAQGLRGLLFAQYLGGSVASAIVNMTQPIAVTFPYLSQYGGITKAAAQMVAATKDATKRTTGDKALDAALKHAEDEGIVAPQEVHQLMAQAQGRAALKSGDGTTAGNAAATASNALSRLSLAWGKVFGVAEQFNRRVTFIAAYRTAVAQGMENPAKFAADAVSDTQFTYNKGNKPKWARGAIGGTLFTFKQYSINYVELLHRMWTQGGPEGKKAALLALAVLFLMSGADGLPFAQDAEDVIDGAMQRLGYNFSAKRARQEFFANMLGAEDGDLADRVIAHGVSGLPGVPIDVAGRFGLGNLIPGTGLLTKKADHTSDAMEILGPAGDFAQRAGQAAGQLLTGDVATAANTIAPTAARNMAKAYDMANTGMYRDSRGRKVIDTDGYDAFAKAIGFQPNSVARVQEATAQTQQMIGQAKLRETELADQLAEAMFERDPEKVQSARDAIARWNEDNPTSPIKIGAPQLAKRLRAMRMSKTDRIAKTAPAEIRATVKRELAGSAP